MRVVHHESELGDWIIAIRAARAEPGLVSPLTGWSERRTGFPARREPPTPWVQLIIGLGDPTDAWPDGMPRESARRFRAFLAPLDPRPILVATAGRHSEGVQVGLNPVLARAALGVGFSDLHGQSIELSELLGPSADLLLEGVAAARSWEGRFGLVEQFLADRAGRAAPSPAASYAWRRLVGSRGRLPVAELAAEMGMSRQRLASLFREHVGASPKTLAAVARMQHAISLLRRDPVRPVADIAVACGYSDQQHLSRDLTRLAGRPPGSLRADLLPGDGGIAARC